MARPAVGPALGRLLQHALYMTLCVTRCSSPAPFLAPLPSLSIHFCPSRFFRGAHSGVTRSLRGGVEGGADAGTGPRPPVFPPGGADACTPRQGVTLLYGPSICTRYVQMDLRRSQVLRPFPTPGLGTLWVAGEPLRDRRFACLP